MANAAYVPNSGSNTVSVIDLDARRQIGVAATGEGPGVARVAPDNRTLVVSNQHAGSVSVYSINETGAPLTLRDAFAGCAGATDIAILPDSSKAFVACSGGRQVMVIWLGAAPDSWRGKQDATLQHDQMLTMLDVGKTPTHIALKPDGNEVFTTNFDSDSISEISTWTNEVLGTYVIGSKPSRGIISRDDSTLCVTNFGADSVSLYSIDDGRMVGSGAHGLTAGCARVLDGRASATGRRRGVIGRGGYPDAEQGRAVAGDDAASGRSPERPGGEVVPHEADATSLIVKFGIAGLAERLAGCGDVGAAEQQKS